MGGLSQAVASDLNSWSDSAPTLNVGQLISVADSTLNNWADAIAKKGDWYLSFGENLNAWDDRLGPLFEIGASASDTLSFSDAALVSLAGTYSISVGDDLDSWNDANVNQSDWFLSFRDTLETWQDNVGIVEDLLITKSDSIDNLSDNAAAALLAGLVVSISSNLNSWDDAATNAFLSRLAMSKRAELIPYIRRYLNDVELPIVKELRVGVGDDVGAFVDDSVG